MTPQNQAVVAAGPKYLIRQVEPGDYEALRAIYASPLAMAGTLQLPLPNAELWRKNLADQPPSTRAFLLVAGTEPVGHLGLWPLQRARRAHAASLGMAVRDDWHNRGVGTALLQEAVSQSDNWLHIIRLELTVYTDNAAAIHLYQKFGFIIEGTHRAYALRDGVYVDAYAMARLHPRPPNPWLNRDMQQARSV
ncbi:MAG: GNAT family N-acetyltransferase [Gammaproteobacteria bacterium]|nr:GNAT family N-acetyltransferase [Gammaproteobacteria bacterium]